MEDRVKSILEFIHDINHTNINTFIDLGCYNGLLTLKVANEVKAKEVYGVDLDKKALEKASLKGIKTLHGDLDVYKLPFVDNYFDLILSAGTLGYLINPDNMLREVYRVLKPGKYFILENSSTLGSWINRFALLLGYQPYGCHVSKEVRHAGMLYRKKMDLAFPKEQFFRCPFRAFTLRALKDLLEYHGFEIIKAKGACGEFPYSKIVKIVDTIFSKRVSWARRNIILGIKPKGQINQE
jgi:ubiquinone/menaquinone biosynthesis C-methylase UbiE